MHRPRTHCHKYNKRKTKILYFSLSFPPFLFSFFFCHSRTLGRKRRSGRGGPLLTARLLKRLYRAWQRGPACPNLAALFILCAVQGVSNALGLCVGEGDDTSHSVFCLLSLVGGDGDGGTTKRQLIEDPGASKLRCTKDYKALLHAELCQM